VKILVGPAATLFLALAFCSIVAPDRKASASIEHPQLLRSANINAFVNGHKTATATVDVARTHQEIAGFGASEAFYEGFLARHPRSKDIYDALFGPEHGLHTDFLRLQNKFRYATDLNFVKDSLAIVKGANSLRSSPMTIVMSSWSPPAVLKSNGSEKNGGTLIKKNGKYDYADFAQYWQDSVTVYRALGIDPTYVSIQNEPDETTDYESCRFNPNEGIFHGEAWAGYAEATDAVYKAFQKLPSPPLLLGPETIGIGYGNETAFTNAVNPKQIYAVTHHLYTGGDKENSDSYIPALQALRNETPGRIRFMTEYYTANGFQTALMIEDELAEEDVSLYLYWPYAWPSADGGGTLLNVENPDEPAKWKTKNGWDYTDGYYALKQFSYFIRAGYRRVDATSSNDEVKLSAYLSPRKDKLVVVALNISPKDANTVRLKLGAFDGATSSVVYRTTFSDRTEQFAALGPLGAERSINLPSHSVVTVEITK
jgi:glucuronoarabinoxylan endo-1,4-beta-xylanase